MRRFLLIATIGLVAAVVAWAILLMTSVCSPLSNTTYECQTRPELSLLWLLPVVASIAYWHMSQTEQTSQNKSSRNSSGKSKARGRQIK